MKNKVNRKDYIKEYSLKNKERIKEYKKLYRLKNKEKLNNYIKEYSLKNKEKLKKLSKLYRLNNKDKIKKYKILYCLKNKNKIKEYKRLYHLKNPHIKNIANAKRRAAKLKATPKFANLNKIKEIYKNCPKGYHVDHIVPLKSKLVCGLHVEWNLQYLTQSANSFKSNKLNEWKTYI
jgi:hypothetical protein